MVRFLNDFVIGGELDNRNRNSVRGWIEFYTEEPEMYSKRYIGNRVVFALTGNLKGDFEGRKFRFLVNDDDFAKLFSFDSRELSAEQIGAVGQVVYETNPVETDTESSSTKAGSEQQTNASDEGDSTEASSRFVMEWFSQNGHLIFEIRNPIVEFEGAYDYLRDPNEDETADQDSDAYPNSSGIAAAGSSMFEMGVEFTDEEDIKSDDNFDSDDEDKDDSGDYSLFSPELEDDVEKSLGLDYQPIDEESEEAFLEYDEADQNRPAPRSEMRSWDEIIPGIDPKVKAMYEKWDEVLYGEKDEPLTWLFEAPLSLPKPEMIQDEQQAWDNLNILLAAMAVHGVAFGMCEHYTAKKAYRLLIEELLPQAHVHPDLVSTGFMQHYDSHEVCEECQAEFGDFTDDHGLDDGGLDDGDEAFEDDDDANDSLGR